MNCINPTEQVLAAYTSEIDDTSPIVILNLLKLKEKVEVDGKTVHGKEAYKRYSLGATKIAWQCGGQVLWMGKVKFTLIAPEGEKWDQVIMLHFPSRSHFLQMLHSPEYAELKPNREAALETSRLLELNSVRLSKIQLWLMAFLYRLKVRFQKA